MPACLRVAGGEERVGKIDTVRIGAVLGASQVLADWRPGRS